MCGVAFVEEREESNKPVILLICYVGVRFGLKYKKKKGKKKKKKGGSEFSRLFPN